MSHAEIMEALTAYLGPNPRQANMSTPYVFGNFPARDATPPVTNARLTRMPPPDCNYSYQCRPVVLNSSTIAHDAAVAAANAADPADESKLFDLAAIRAEAKARAEAAEQAKKSRYWDLATGMAEEAKAKAEAKETEPGCWRHWGRKGVIEIRVHIEEGATGREIGTFPVVATEVSTKAIMESLSPFLTRDLVPKTVWYKPEGELNVHPEYAPFESVIATYVRYWSMWSSNPEKLTVKMLKLYLEPPAVAEYDSSSDDEESYIDVEGMGLDD